MILRHRLALRSSQGSVTTISCYLDLYMLFFSSVYIVQSTALTRNWTSGHERVHTVDATVDLCLSGVTDKVAIQTRS